MSDKNTYAQKGKAIRCDSCGCEPWRFTRDVFNGERSEASQLEGINGYSNPQDGDAIKCPRCEAPILL